MSFRACAYVGCPLHHPQDLGQAIEIVPLSILHQRAIECALHNTNGNKIAAAKLLGIGRQTLYRAIAGSKLVTMRKNPR